MGLLSTVAGPLANRFADTPLAVLIAAGVASFVVLAVVLKRLEAAAVQELDRAFSRLPLVPPSLAAPSHTPLTL